MDTLTNTMNTLENLTTYEQFVYLDVPRKQYEHPELPREEIRTPAEEPRNSQKPQSKIPQVKLGYLRIHEKPEELKPPVVYGNINGRKARIMLDCGCSTYVLSTDFV